MGITTEDQILGLEYAIQIARGKGAETIPEIIEETGLPQPEILAFLIQQQAEAGKSTPSKISHALGVKIDVVYPLHNSGIVHLNILNKAKPLNPQAERLLNIRAPIEDIAKAQGCSENNIRLMLMKTGEYDNYKQTRMARVVKLTPLIKSLIDRRANLKDIAKIAGCSLDSLVMRLEIDELYIPYHEDTQQKKNLLRNIINASAKLMYKKADEYELIALNVLASSKKKTKGADVSSLAMVYRRYFQAKENEKRIPLSEIGKGTGMYPAEIAKFLAFIGESPLNGKRERVPVPGWKKQAIEDIYTSGIPLSINDTAYFLGLKKHNVLAYKKHLRKSGTTLSGSCPNNSVSYCFNSRLNYSLASQIYEARDIILEIVQEEGRPLPDLASNIADLIKGLKREEIISVALEHESQIAPVIKKVLQIIYPKKEITNPYAP
jgi:hypothetical protein